MRQADLLEHMPGVVTLFRGGLFIQRDGGEVTGADHVGGAERCVDDRACDVSFGPGVDGGVDDADAFSKFPDIGFAERLAEDASGSFGEEHLSGQRSGKRGLAAAVWSEQGDDLAPFDLTVNVMQDRRVAASDVQASSFDGVMCFVHAAMLVAVLPQQQQHRRKLVFALWLNICESVAATDPFVYQEYDMAEPLVGIIMGSTSDEPTMQHAADMLKTLGVPYEMSVVSAHRTPHRMVEYAGTAEERGLKVIIAGAGGAAHLPGMVASMTVLPVLGVPVKSRAMNGLDSLLSIVQMPGGVPVGTLAIGDSGAKNAGLLAASIVATFDDKVRENLRAFREKQTQTVLETPLVGEQPF